MVVVPVAVVPLAWLSYQRLWCHWRGCSAIGCGAIGVVVVPVAVVPLAWLCCQFVVVPVAVLQQPS